MLFVIAYFYYKIMETIHLYNLSNLCRVCLSKTEVMSNLFESTKGLYDIFKEVVNFELEKNETFPNYLCSSCEEKVVICHEFINQCRKTNDLLEKYRNYDFKIEDERKDCLESVPITEIIEYVSNDEDSGKNFQETVGVVPRNLRKLRLKQYSYNDVMKAIDEQKKKFDIIKSCAKCKFQGRNSRALAVHMAFIHKETKGKWCVTCNAEFDDLKGHSETHNSKEHICEFCKKILSSRGHLVEHLMCHTTVRPYKCEMCDKTFVSTRHLRIHNRTHTNEKPFTCKLCPNAFAQMVSLRMHVERHHKNENNFNCRECKNSFVSEGSLKSHSCVDNAADKEVEKVIEVNVEKQNYCSVCCKNVRSLGVHNKKCHDSSKNSEINATKLCNVCGKQFTNYSKLKVHMRIHTGETPYSCSYCDRKMSTRNHLVVHERTHTGEKPHICQVCNKGFAQTSVLNTHMKLHTGRPEMCMICGKRFCRPAELRLHMRKHTGEKPFVCAYCGKSFVQRSHLVEHTRRHSDDRPFKCIHCDRTFRQKSSLKTHEQIHTGEKPYRCSQCPYACRQSYSLTVHMKQHTTDTPRLDKPHCCPYCHKSYTTLAMLNSHIESVHMSKS